MRDADRTADPHWRPPVPGAEPAAPTALPRPRRRWRRDARPPSRASGWLLALGLGAALALVTVASLSDPRSLGTQLDEAVAGLRGLGDRAGQGLAESRDAAAQASRGAAEGLGTAFSDAATSARIKAALAADPALSASRIVVTTRNGVVRLEGPAPDEKSRQRATVLASARDGVKAVDNRLVLPQPGQVVAVVDGVPQQPRAAASAAASAPAVAASQARAAVPVDDGAITRSVLQALATDPLIAQAGVDVKTVAGIVLMEGTVPDEATRNHALALASTQAGVRAVDNRLLLDPPTQEALLTPRASGGASLP
ncbi:BON domain-containing protein [Pelomonas sp. P7]|uniref:BON domain-containing protein n=1 Tax=Pelomonas caseinilytica TaxID=2906763 RepID=A0ABS8XCG4_9BURK|nr:BON domain-containing protein [Pelomonas sp. P7]MCE4538637.1 BON domain-containing protein [Pelomonas sp. P7]